MLFGASGAHAVSPQLVVVAGSLAAEESADPADENSEDPSEEEDSSDDASDDEESDNTDDENSDSEEPTETPTPEPTFTDPGSGATDDVTEMPTEDAGTTSEAGSSPLGWILLAGGVACAGAAVAVYRRNRHIM
jgi:cobalamin biosynthesis Mg chelatase CobN